MSKTKAKASLIVAKKQDLVNYFLTESQRTWINKQNDKEFQRRQLDPKREVFFFTGRAGALNATQMQAFNDMKIHGWEPMAVAQRCSTNEFVLVCRGISNGMYGVVYPDGKIERSVSRVEFKGSRWTPEVKEEADEEAENEAALAATADPAKRIPQAPEQVPSAVRTQHPMWAGD